MLAYAVLALGAALLAAAAANAVLLQTEKRTLEYGQAVAIDGRRMNVNIFGAGDKCLVFMPGFGTYDVKTDYMPLICRLQGSFRIIVPEPFGYGLSDDTKARRTVENITRELHQCLERLGIAKYTLVAHSISGVYALYYSNQYPAEVEAVVGIDTSIPTRLRFSRPASIHPANALLRHSGLLRIAAAIKPSLFISSGAGAYSRQQRDSIRKISLRNYCCAAVMSQDRETVNNYKKVENMQLAKGLRVLFFVSAESTAGHGDWWLAQHERQLDGLDNSRLIVYDGPHYLHRTHAEEMAREITAFLA